MRYLASGRSVKSGVSLLHVVGVKSRSSRAKARSEPRGIARRRRDSRAARVCFFARGCACLRQDFRILGDADIHSPFDALRPCAKACASFCLFGGKLDIAAELMLQNSDLYKIFSDLVTMLLILLKVSAVKGGFCEC